MIAERVHAASRIRRKLILLHTVFSVTLGVILILTLRVPLDDLQRVSAQRDALLAVELARAQPTLVESSLVGGIAIEHGTSADLGLEESLAQRLADAPDEPFVTFNGTGRATAYAFDPGAQRYVRASSVSIAGQQSAKNVYLLMTVALLVVYALIALTLEVFVLPRQVYWPIERLRRADDAVQRGQRENELIPEEQIGPDELGEIMRSRNASIEKLRDQETRLNDALDEIERVAAELKRKNHLLETARRNMADQDRLASLGMMSAGIAHELNTPLAVLKGCVEELRAVDAPPNPTRVALMLRVLGRLERLSESLLDFARARPPAQDTVRLRETLDEAWTLVRLDRSAGNARFDNRTPERATVLGDPDRFTQVFVNLLRNAVDAHPGDRADELVIEAETRCAERDGAVWMTVFVRDNGPGIPPDLLPRLFEPFASTRLDAKGTGLGLAVAEGIVKEHGGVIVARNRTGSTTGAEFELVFPARDQDPYDAPMTTTHDEDHA